MHTHDSRHVRRRGIGLAILPVIGLLATLVLGPSTAVRRADAAATGFTGLTPARLLDTRPGAATIDGTQQGTGTFGPAESRDLPILGRGGIPTTGVAAIAINITAITPTADSFITIHPTGTTRPNASNLNLAPGRTLPNMAIVPLGTDGKITIYNDTGNTHLAIDILGWFPTVDGGEVTPPTTTPPTTVAPILPSTAIVSRAVNNRSHGGNSTEAIISRDGNKVAFTSLASNLVAGDTNGMLDVFVADLTTNVVERVSVTDTEAQLGVASTSPAISDDGRFVAFVTSAPIVAADTNGTDDVYRRDLQTGTTTLVSIRTNNTQFVSANAPAISGDGNVVAFDAVQPDAFNLPENQTLEHHVFVRDVAAGTAVQASLAAGNFDTGGGGASISQDGDKIAFSKHYSHSGGGNHVFRYDRSANTLTQFTPHITGNDGAIQGGTQPVLSDDGNAAVYRRGDHVYFYQAFGSEQAVDVSTANVVGNATGTRARFVGSTFDVIFESDATNLVVGDTNGQRDIFLRTTGTTKATTLLSTKVKAGFVTQSNGFSTSASMSGNGRLVTVSNATNLAPLTDNNALNVMLRTGTSTTAHRLLDISAFTAVAHGASDRSNMSPDGRYVVFDSSADDVTNGHPNVGTDSYLLDRVTQQISFVGVRANGLTFAAGTNSPDVSDNGNTVAFHAVANGDIFGIQQVWAHDRTTGLTELASGTTTNGLSSLPASEARLSGNGRFVVFTSGASNLIAGDTNSRIDVFVRDLQTNTTERVNLTSTGGEPTGALPQFTTATPTISADGRFVSFDSSATNLVPGATTAQRRVYVRDRLLGTTTLVARGSAGEISDDGTVVVFNSFDALTVDDTNGAGDLFTMVLATGAIGRVSVASGNVQAAQGGSSPSISADGRFVGFESASPDLVAGDTNGAGDVFLHDRQTGLTTRVGLGAAGAEANGQSFTCAVSADGRFVTFSSFADNLATGDLNGATDVFVRDRGVPAA